EIHLSLVSQSKDRSNVSWNIFVSEMRSLMLSRYDNTPMSDYKAVWKQAFKNAANSLSYSIESNEQEDTWNEEIIDALKETKTSESNFDESCHKLCTSTSSLLYQKKLLPVDYSNMSEVFSKLTKKWKLKSGRMVEDVVFKASKEFIVEHPAHSFIFNTKDPAWKEAFSQSEFDEIEAAGNIFQFNKPDIYDAVATVEAHPIDNPDKFWLKQSILNYAMLFIDNEVLLPSETEQDLLDDVFGFIKTSCRLSGTKAYGAKQSQSSSECKNSTRSIGSLSKVQRKQSAENADLSFKYISHELFCLEIGLKDHGPNDTKELNESSIKIPLMMKNFYLHLISQYKMNPNGIKIMGIIISGPNIKALGMSFNNGSMSLLSISDRLHMPESICEIPRLLPPVLNLIYNLNKVLKSTANELKEMNSSVSIEPKIKFSLPPCFVPVAATTINKKRKSKENH
ncbi:hypothetical protein BD408DRAFT_465276, partial [Parasitella parasitica]